VKKGAGDRSPALENSQASACLEKCTAARLAELGELHAEPSGRSSATFLSRCLGRTKTPFLYSAALVMSSSYPGVWLANGDIAPTDVRAIAIAVLDRTKLSVRLSRTRKLLLAGNGLTATAQQFLSILGFSI
jgi:hypothetical protein